MGHGLGSAAVAAAVGEENGRGTDAEEAVGDEHRAVVAKVPVLRDVLRAHHERPAVWVHLSPTFPPMTFGHYHCNIRANVYQQSIT